MSILDTLSSALGGTQPGAGASAAVISEVVAVLQTQQGGGLSGLLQGFERAGLGHLFQSWVGTGQNLPVSPDQIRTALGSGLLERIAQSSGLQQSEVAQHLSAVLPQIVDHLTPNGQLPQGEMSAALSGLAQRFLRG